jgi:hypothetical protein
MAHWGSIRIRILDFFRFHVVCEDPSHSLNIPLTCCRNPQLITHHRELGLKYLECKVLQAEGIEEKSSALPSNP